MSDHQQEYTRLQAERDALKAALDEAAEWMEFAAKKLAAPESTANAKKFGAVKYMADFARGATYRAMDARGTLARLGK